MSDNSGSSGDSKAGEKSPKQDSKPSMNPMRGFLAWGMIVAVMVLSFQLFSKRGDEYTDIDFSPDFVKYVESGFVDSCEGLERRRWRLGSVQRRHPAEPRRWHGSFPS